MNSTSSDLNEMQLEQLKEARPSIDEESVRCLHVAITHFTTSTSYSILRQMPLKSVVSVLESVEVPCETFMDLVESGAIEFCSDEAVNEGVIQAIIVALEQLSTEPTSDDQVYVTSEASVLGAITPVGVAREIIERPDIPVYGSIESEKRISDGLARLVSSSAFKRVKDLRVERFWSRDIVSAPFIESMKFGELIHVRVEDLLKKRSFGNAKVHGLLCCIDDCLADIGEIGEQFAMPTPDGSRRTPAVLASYPSAESGQRPGSQGSFESHSGNDALFDRLVYSGVRSLIENTQESVVKGFLTDLIETQGVEWILEQALGSAAEQELEERKAFVENSYKKFAAESLTALKTILRTSGTDEATLASIAFSTDPSSELCQLGIRLLLPACGASVVRVWDQSFEGYWSTSQAARVAIEGVFKRLPMADVDVKIELEALLPTLPLGRVLEVFALRARLDEQNSEWSQAG